MLIILEGPDGSGKSALAEKLSKQLNVGSIMHHGNYLGEESIFNRYATSLRNAASSDKTTIFDRCWLSEPVYGEVMRGGDDRLGTMARMLERAAMGQAAVVVLCLPPWSKVKENFLKRASIEYPRNTVQVERVWKAYRHLNTALPFTTYDYTKDSVDTLVSDIKRLHTKYHNEGPGIGLWHPNRVSLLVGEAQNSSAFEVQHPSWVFVSDQGCSPWLADKLAELEVGENELYWANAETPQGSQTNLAFIERLSPMRVITLGKVADARLRELDIPHITLPHPQYMKRFHYHKPWGELRQALRMKGAHDFTMA